MKHIALLLLVSTATTHTACTHDCNINLDPMWDNLEHSNTKEKQFGGKWILVGSITFRKKSQQLAKLEKIILQWHGDAIDYLNGSLYKKEPSKAFLPIEDNLLCDGSWNKPEQQLMLDFRDRKQTLGSLNIFYLVFTVPESIEQKLKKGYFYLAPANLPEPFDTKEQDLKLDLAQLAREKEVSIQKTKIGM